MGDVQISAAHCSGCGLCVDLCPDKAIRLRDGVAVLIHDDCFLCGHCRAVCPEDAILIPPLVTRLSLTNIPLAQQNTNSSVSPGQLAELMARRRSCRHFQKQQLDIAMFHDLVQFGITAPSGTNSQQWGFTILATREDVLALGRLVGNYYRKVNRLAIIPGLAEGLRLIGRPALWRYRRRYHESVAEALREWGERGIDRLFHGATGAILVSGRRTASCPVEDSLLATQNILLAAESMGLGTCLIGFAVEAARRERLIRDVLQLQADEELHSVIALGYPAVRWRRFSGRRGAQTRVLSLA
jgi:nitroreductase/NAD-dependent dihydropyrimidine dehydrogenase PreA subunit